jgi:tetratricopeptide (TPR) repeat protein
MFRRLKLDVRQLQKGGMMSRLFGKKKPAFLSSLRLEDRVAISNLNPLVYEMIIKEKKGEDTPMVITDDETTLALLRKLTVSDLETLSESVKHSMKADNSSNPSEQASLYRRAASLNPYNDLALMSYGCALANQGNLREGIKWVEKALKVNPNNERALRNLHGMRSAL